MLRSPTWIRICRVGGGILGGIRLYGLISMWPVTLRDRWGHVKGGPEKWQIC